MSHLATFRHDAHQSFVRARWENAVSLGFASRRRDQIVTSSLSEPKVIIISLGGTIASTNTGVGASGVRPQLSADDIVAAVPGLRQYADVEAVAFRQLPSGDLDLSDLTALAKVIDAYFAEGAFGVVVVQGTDTMEETSFALDLLVKGTGPVVVTGAMRNPTTAGADGPANVLAAVQVAASRAAQGLGTLVVVNDEIHAARFVRKTHATNVATFQSPSVGPIGWITEGHPRIVFRMTRLRTPTLGEGLVPPVALLTAVLGDDARLLNTIEGVGYAGLVIEAFGGGHVPAQIMPSLAALADRIPVILASRTGGGEVLRATYGFEGSERDMLSRGLISAGFLDGPKARVFLSLLLAHGFDRDAIRAAFDELNVSVSSFQQ